jgi:hypothetical protein
MTTLTTPQRVIIFGGSNAKRIVPFLLKLTKGRGDSQRTRRSRTGRSFQRSRKQRRIEEET